MSSLKPTSTSLAIFRRLSPWQAWLLLSALALTSMAAHSDEASFPGLKALMSEEEFAAAGLDRLSPAQRAVLNRWLTQRARFSLEEIEATGSTSSTAAEVSEERTQSADTQTKEAKQAAKKSRRVVAKRLSRAERNAVKPVRTRIVGPFRGWSGATIFALENGEYWKQRHIGRYYYKAESPEVEIYKNRLGFWEMRILATGKTVKVSRFEP